MLKCPENAFILNKIIKDFRFQIGAELGVRRGEFSAFLLQENPNLRMVCVDLWQDSVILNEKHNHNENYRKFLKNCGSYANRVETHRMSLDDASKIVRDNSLEFIFIDATHTYGALTNDYALWSPKVAVGGLISGHDYHPSFDNGGVVRAVHEFDPYIIKTHDQNEVYELLKNKKNVVDMKSTCWYIWRNL